MKIRREKWTLWIMLAVILLAACSGDDTQSDTYVGDDTQEIRFSADVRQVKSGTRITTIDNPAGLQLQDIRIDAYVNGTNTSVISRAMLHYADASWKFWGSGVETHYYWPIEGSYIAIEGSYIGPVTSLDFVGYCPFTKPGNLPSEPAYASSAVTFSCDMSNYMTSAAQASLTEFMYAILPAQTYATQVAARGRLPLVFQHPFARIKFVNGNPATIMIKKITFKNIYTKGSFSSNSNPKWSGLDSKADFVADINHANYNLPAAIGDSYIVLPQDFAGDIEVVATWIDWGEDFDHTVTATVPTTWQPGYSYTYTFNIRNRDLIVNLEKYTEQW